MARKSSALGWLVGLGALTVAGVGIYFYEKSQPAAPAGGGTGATGPSGPPVLAAGQTAVTFTQAQIAELNTLHPTWATQGVPLATWNGYLSGFQVGLWNAGFRPTAT